MFSLCSPFVGGGGNLPSEQGGTYFPRSGWGGGTYLPRSGRGGGTYLPGGGVPTFRGHDGGYLPSQVGGTYSGRYPPPG